MIYIPHFSTRNERVTINIELLKYVRCIVIVLATNFRMIVLINIRKRSSQNSKIVILEVDNLKKGWVDINLELMLRKKADR